MVAVFQGSFYELYRASRLGVRANWLNLKPRKRLRGIVSIQQYLNWVIMLGRSTAQKLAIYLQELRMVQLECMIHSNPHMWTLLSTLPSMKRSSRWTRPCHRGTSTRCHLCSGIRSIQGSLSQGPLIRTSIFGTQTLIRYISIWASTACSFWCCDLLVMSELYCEYYVRGRVSLIFLLGETWLTNL